MEDDLDKKQQYLRTEILDKGYDPKEFNDYICSVRNEENIDLNNWTLEELSQVVKSFVEESQNKENQNEQKEQENNQIENTEKNENTDSINDQGPNPKPEPEQKPKEKEKDNYVNNLNLTQSTISITPKSDAYDYYERRVICTKLEKNNITDREDIFIVVTEPQKVKPGFFSMTYYQYVIKVYPLNIEVVRKVSDFYFLSQKLPLIDPVSYIPELPTFSFGVKDDSPEKLRFYQNYLNLLIENKYLRTIPIVYDFITLPQNMWNDKAKKVYSKIKEPQSFSDIPSLNGERLVRIKKEDEKKANTIKDDITAKNEIYKELGQHFDELLLNLDKISSNLKNASICFKLLEKRYMNNKILNQIYGNLFNVFKVWGDDYIIQKNLIRDEIKYFFLFISKELNAFLRNFENYRLARDNYKGMFDKVKKYKTPSKEDLDLLKSAKKYYGFELVEINNEYINLMKRQGKRLMKQFMKYKDSKNILFQDLKNCCGINNFQEQISLQEEQKEKEKEELIIEKKNTAQEDDSKNKEQEQEQKKDLDKDKSDNIDNNKEIEKKEEIITTDSNKNNTNQTGDNNIERMEEKKENDNNTKIIENNNINEIKIENKVIDKKDNINIDEKTLEKKNSKDDIKSDQEENKEDKKVKNDINNENKDIIKEDKKEEIKNEDNIKDDDSKGNNGNNIINEDKKENLDEKKEDKEKEIKDNNNENNNNILEKEGKNDNEKNNDDNK